MHLLQQPFLASFEKHLQTLDVAAILFLADPQVAGRRALIDAGQQAGAKPLPTLVRFADVQRAGAELEDPLQHLNGAAQAPRRWRTDRTA